MNFITNIISKTKNAAEQAIISASEGKIVWIELDKIRIDSEIKGLFNQNETEINNIATDMKSHGFNPANPVTLSQDNILVEGHTRYLAAQKAGIKKIAVVYKHFASRLEMLEYAYKQQLHRRNLSEQEIFTSYKKLRELTNEDGKKAKTDVEIAEELHVSPRQLAKMKEVEKKASPEIMEAFTGGTISLNQAYNQMKDDLKPAEEQVEVQKEDAAIPAADETKKTSSKPKKASTDKPAMEKLNLKFKPEDFALLQNAADASNLSVAEYVMNLVMSSVQTNSAIETVSEMETA